MTEPPASDPSARKRIAVIIPCYRVSAHVNDVIGAIGEWAEAIYCVDDKCPDNSGEFIRENCTDPRVRVIERPENGGVGAATMTGYAAAIEDGFDVLVKIDGDGQMDPRYGPELARPILDGEADYAKGNRFFSMETITGMPGVRLVGNAGLSFMSKLSTGYWDLFDPTNGYTALEARVAAELPFHKIHNRYFFESDLLFRLSLLRARVVELPLIATYADEESNLSELNALLTFPFLHLRNFAKRVSYNYFVRNFSTASLTLCAGVVLTLFGVLFGFASWTSAAESETVATAGTVMLAGLPILLGLQFLLSFLSHDMTMVPRTPVHARLSTIRPLGAEDRPVPRPAPNVEPSPTRGSALPERIALFSVLALGIWALFSWGAVYGGASFNLLFYLTPVVLALAVVAYRWIGAAPAGEPTPHELAPDDPDDPKRITEKIPLIMLAMTGAGLLTWYASGGWWLLAWGLGVAYLASAVLVMPQGVRLDVRPRASAGDLIAILVAGSVAAVCANYLAIGNLDDAYYFNAVISTLTRPELPVLSFDGMYGEPDVPIQQLIHRPQTFEVLVALVARTLGVSPALAYFAIVPMTFGFASTVAHWLLFKSLHPRAAWLATLLTVAVMFAWGDKTQTYGNFTLVRLFQGKAVFFSVFVPLVVWAGLRYSQAPSGRNWVLFMLTQCAATMCSSTALVVTPLAAGFAIVGGWDWSRRGFKMVLLGVLASLPMILILLMVKYELSVFGELTSTGATYPWSINFGKTVRGPIAFFGFLALPLLLASARLRSAAWTHRYVAIAFIVLCNGEVTGYLNDHVAKVFSWRLYWALPFPGLLALFFAGGIYAFVIAAARKEIITTRLFAPVMAAVMVLPFLTGGRTSYRPQSSVGFNIPKGFPAKWNSARKIIEFSRADSLVLAPEGISSRLTGFETRPRLVVVRGFYLKNLTRHWGQAETKKRRELNNFVRGATSRSRWVSAFEEINERCVDIVVLSPKAAKSNPLKVMMREQHFVRRQGQIWVRTKAAYEACKEDTLKSLPKPRAKPAAGVRQPGGKPGAKTPPRAPRRVHTDPGSKPRAAKETEAATAARVQQAAAEAKQRRDAASTQKNNARKKKDQRP